MRELDVVAKTNQQVVQTAIIVIISTIVGYLIEYVRGSRTLTYFVSVFIPLAIIAIFLYIAYKIPKFKHIYKYIAIYAFLLNWIFILAVSYKVIQFTVIFPFIAIYFLYFDIKIMKIAAAITIVFSIFKVILNIYYYQATDDFIMTEYTVLIIAAVYFGYNSVITARLSKSFRDTQLSDIMDEQKKNFELLENTMNVLNAVENTTENVSNIYNSLIKASDEATQSIRVLLNGVNEISDNITQQTGMTENIHVKLKETAEIANTLEILGNDFGKQINEGRQLIEELNTSSNTINKNNEDVYNKMMELNEDSNKIKSIIGIIQNISAQTNLLALNASIESARAGAAGKGFGVVAESIRVLSMQTNDAIAGINTLIENLQKSSLASLKAVEGSKNMNLVQEEIIKKSKQSYDDIFATMQKVTSEISDSNKMVSEAVEYNQKVVNSIDNIAAAIQQVKSNTEITSNAVNLSGELTSNVKSYIDELSNTVKKANE